MNVLAVVGSSCSRSGYKCHTDKDCCSSRRPLLCINNKCCFDHDIGIKNAKYAFLCCNKKTMVVENQLYCEPVGCKTWGRNCTTSDDCCKNGDKCCNSGTIQYICYDGKCLMKGGRGKGAYCEEDSVCQSGNCKKGYDCTGSADKHGRCQAGKCT